MLNIHARIRLKLKVLAALLLPAVMPTALNAQDAGDGRWRLHLSYSDITEIEPTG